ncbi:helix-turn-helix domain-containing protein [Streptomyces sp. NPDC002588]|uniref:helix-turn-helix domain-containing protein n=1 Tax=Streptomyces sp. NPDC002588 TaxID=3154419 RepID=UPI003322F7DD
MAGDEFSELLGRLKERSGLSYGVLGKRLHTSTSTLHRYVNGDAVPTDYAPVERFARVCKATPEELVELHRRWVLADARRRQRAAGASAEGEAGATEVVESGAEPMAAEAPAGPGTGAATDAEAGSEIGSVGDRPNRPAAAPLARRRTVVLAGTAVAAAVVSAALLVNLLSGKGDDDRSGQQIMGAASRSAGSVTESPAASGSADAKGGSASPSATHSGSPTAASSTSAAASRGTGAAQGGGSEDGATAPTVTVNPYKWEDPCGPHILIDEEPDQVPPPPNEPDARGWATALGGVTGGQQMVALTVQGTGKATVVLEDLHVRVVDKSAPLAWNDYRMHDGCGGGVETVGFDANLDDRQPTVSPRSGQRDFPYKVSESDPEVFYLFADARASNVSWYLELDWSSGDRHGVLRVDDNGKPFRTSGNVGRPSYLYPNGSSEWERDQTNPNVPG